jgi:hypothetical protein
MSYRVPQLHYSTPLRLFPVLLTRESKGAWYDTQRVAAGHYQLREKHTRILNLLALLPGVYLSVPTSRLLHATQLLTYFLTACGHLSVVLPECTESLFIEQVVKISKA